MIECLNKSLAESFALIFISLNGLGLMFIVMLIALNLISSLFMYKSRTIDSPNILAFKHLSIHAFPPPSIKSNFLRIFSLAARSPLLENTR